MHSVQPAPPTATSSRPACDSPPPACLQQAGGAAYVHSAQLRLDRTTVSGNSAAEGGGVCLAGGSRLEATRSRLAGNRLTAGGAAAASAMAGADLLVVDPHTSAAYFQPLPAAGELSGEAGLWRGATAGGKGPAPWGTPCTLCLHRASCVRVSRHAVVPVVRAPDRR